MAPTGEIAFTRAPQPYSQVRAIYA
eukprot:SAG11_NODE_20928_length_435_cov_1.571429_1_plen_24_part_10